MDGPRCSVADPLTILFLSEDVLIDQSDFYEHVYAVNANAEWDAAPILRMPASRWWFRTERSSISPTPPRRWSS